MPKAAEVTHTDIVLDGQGFNVTIIEDRPDFWLVGMTPDTPGPKANEALHRFSAALLYRDEWPTLQEAKRAVRAAIDLTGGRWNGWHKEAYSK